MFWPSMNLKSSKVSFFEKAIFFDIQLKSENFSCVLSKKFSSCCKLLEPIYDSQKTLSFSVYSVTGWFEVATYFFHVSGLVL